MEKTKFIEEIHTIEPGIDSDYVTDIVDITLNRLHIEEETKALEYAQGNKLSIALMEEMSELVEAISHRMRGRTNDDYDILEESADVIINVLCALKLFDISTEDLQKAIMVKCKRQEQKTGWNE